MSDRTRSKITMSHAGMSLQSHVVSHLRHLGEPSVVRSSVATTAMLGVALLIGLPGVPWVRWTLLALLGLGMRLDRRTRPGLAPRARQAAAHERPRGGLVAQPGLGGRGMPRCRRRASLAPTTEFTGLGALLRTSYQARPPPS